MLLEILWNTVHLKEGPGYINDLKLYLGTLQLHINIVDSNDNMIDIGVETGVEEQQFNMVLIIIRLIGCK